MSQRHLNLGGSPAWEEGVSQLPHSRKGPPKGSPRPLALSLRVSPPSLEAQSVAQLPLLLTTVPQVHACGRLASQTSPHAMVTHLPPSHHRRS